MWQRPRAPPGGLYGDDENVPGRATMKLRSIEIQRECKASPLKGSPGLNQRSPVGMFVSGPSGPARALGALLVLAGLAFFALALAAFGDGWRVGIDTERPGELVTRGVFGISRNPIFVFMNAYAVGTFLLTGRLFFLIFALLAIAAMHAQIRREEAFLEDAYGDAYRSYRAATPRYLLW